MHKYVHIPIHTSYMIIYVYSYMCIAHVYVHVYYKQKISEMKEDTLWEDDLMG